MAGCNDDRTSADIVKRTVFQENVASPVEVVYGAFDPTIFYVMPVVIVSCCHPCILKRLELAVVE